MGEKIEVEVDGEMFEVDVEQKDDLWIARINGEKHEIRIKGGDVNATVTPRRTRRKSGGGKITSSMPGKVISLLVDEGDCVEEGDVCLILEAMKMQNEMRSPIGGTVRSISCVEGESVEANMPLMFIEANDEATG